MTSSATTLRPLIRLAGRSQGGDTWQVWVWGRCHVSRVTCHEEMWRCDAGHDGSPRAALPRLAAGYRQRWGHFVDIDKNDFVNLVPLKVGWKSMRLLMFFKSFPTLINVCRIQNRRRMCDAWLGFYCNSLNVTIWRTHRGPFYRTRQASVIKTFVKSWN